MSIESIKGWMPFIVLGAAMLASFTTLQVKFANAEDTVKQLQVEIKESREFQQFLRERAAVSQNTLERLKTDQVDIKKLLEALLAESRNGTK